MKNECLVCGIPLMTEEVNFCSRDCRSKGKVNKCKTCGDTLDSLEGSEYCCDICAEVGRLHAKSQKWEEFMLTKDVIKKPVTCKCCGKVIPGGTKLTVYCSIKCRGGRRL